MGQFFQNGFNIYVSLVIAGGVVGEEFYKEIRKAALSKLSESMQAFDLQACTPDNAGRVSRALRGRYHPTWGCGPAGWGHSHHHSVSFIRQDRHCRTI